jgi:glycosyltransferase involved in cell wall biosynthesis
MRVRRPNRNPSTRRREATRGDRVVGTYVNTHGPVADTGSTGQGSSPSLRAQSVPVRILICALQGPHPVVNGYRLAVAALLEQLGKRHEVRLLAFRMPDQSASDNGIRLVEAPTRSPLRNIGLLARGWLRRRPLLADLYTARLRGPLQEELEGFSPDIVHVAGSQLGGIGRLLDQRASVLGAYDARHLNVEAERLLARGVRRRLLQAEAGRVRRFEAAEYPFFDHIVMVSEEDRSELKALSPNLEITVIPNGVDAEFYDSDQGVTREQGLVLFTGVMSYAPNILAAEFLARQVFPLVRARRPEARLAIVGRAPAERVQALAAVDGVDVIGEVPDLRPWLRRSRSYACPMLSGTGIKNKLLEAMASELACVVTPLALQGLDVTPGVELLVGETEHELAERLVEVLEDDETALRLGSAARDYVCRRHDWHAVALGYERVYREVLERAGR